MLTCFAINALAQSNAVQFGVRRLFLVEISREEGDYVIVP
jgi:hypothetical protein